MDSEEQAVEQLPVAPEETPAARFFMLGILIIVFLAAGLCVIAILALLVLAIENIFETTTLII